VNDQSVKNAAAECIESMGPWPFITKRIYRLADRSIAIWSSRHHRKSLVSPETARSLATTERLLRCLWMPRKLNWWMGVIFAIGSSLFGLASVLSLAPTIAQAWSLDALDISIIFFVGSTQFTTAAYLQLFQAANSTDFLQNQTGSGQRMRIFGWRPHDIGWLSCALQFVGTILFNFNTFDASIPALNWFQQDLLIWAPNIVGSILFLTSGYLAFAETCHAHWLWNPNSISWWIVFTNLLGCIGFMVSAVFAIALPGGPHSEAATISVLFTLLGAVGFLFGSLLMLPEAVLATD